MSIFSDIPQTIETVLTGDDYFSNVRFIKSFSLNTNPNPMTKVCISTGIDEIKVQKLGNLGYIGKSSTKEYFGSHTDISLHLDIYSPQSIGGDGCYNTFLKICEVLTRNSTFDITSILFGKINYDSDTFCFHSACKLNIKLFLASEESSLNNISEICVAKS